MANLGEAFSQLHDYLKIFRENIDLQLVLEEQTIEMKDLDIQLKKATETLENKKCEIKKINEIEEKRTETLKMADEAELIVESKSEDFTKDLISAKDLLQPTIDEIKLKLHDDGTKDIHEAAKLGSLTGVMYHHLSGNYCDHGRESCFDCINAQDSDEYEWTPLHCATANGHRKVALYLLENGAYIDSYDKNKQTPLLWAATHGHLDVVELLLDYGAKVNHRDVAGETILMWSVTRRPLALDIIKLLIERGASTTYVDYNFKFTVLDWAKDIKRNDIAEYLSNLNLN